MKKPRIVIITVIITLVVVFVIAGVIKSKVSAKKKGKVVRIELVQRGELVDEVHILLGARLNQARKLR